ncbi:hypothetical protein ACIG0C_36665 [Kitasatospora aureofaciens]|uniref:Uncharacterized protein n=1 Tax=Kitasatospora aureofaciens TaxID=1894 RepID=A0A1E7N1M8_KITAU|nr:hypothetical protein [Kitasatospora aureofaciens]QEV03553.1 hypothetical protein CP971_34000 [Streptomyces viridifaciens]ARF82037.1 hypothetical protein B6264_26950 [Kitasatospora aureofaciens]OEV34599.1 hypothetical protein HS99_0008845 [Kitasatospora aureofaciens]UKZ03786.1 hypothetical protein BOQ63_006820 [Streptomyces viridifaciens]GGV07023.1 hypothetical protein GCM10010502_72710 [Kitasatospora aureofaciens]
MFDQAAELPLHVVTGVLLDAALLSLTSPSTTAFRKKWAEGEATYESAQYAGLPDPTPQTAQALRWLLSDERPATRTYGLIAHQARHRYDIPVPFTAGWLISAIKWGGGRAESFPVEADVEAFVLAATTEAALKQL